MESGSTPKEKKRANDLSGRDWMRFSMSVWHDIKRTQDEISLHHPAMFPIALAERIIRCFTPSGGATVLDPFCGSGTTLIAAKNLFKESIGLDIVPEYVELAQMRLAQLSLFQQTATVHLADARSLSSVVRKNSVDLCFTSPPYWNILKQKRTADYKAVRHYGDLVGDLGSIDSYDEFLSELEKVWSELFEVVKVKKYAVINAMDLRKGPNFLPFHIDVINGMGRAGFSLDDIIIWDRTQEYNNLRALGYPTVFRVNKVHEYLLVFRKP